MEEEKIEETVENPGEEETSEETTSDEGQETSTKPEPSSEKKDGDVSKEDAIRQRDAAWARYKKEQSKTAELQEKLKNAAPSNLGDNEIEKIVQITSSLAGLDATERARVMKEAKVSELSLEEARKSDDFKLWRSAYRAEKEKNKSPEPSTKQSETTGDVIERFKKGELNKKEKNEFLRDLGVVRDYSKFGERPVNRLGEKSSIRPPGI